MKRTMRGRRATVWWMLGPYLWLGLPALVLFAALPLWIIATRTTSWRPAFIGPWVMLVVHMVAMGMVARRGILVRRELRAADGLLCIGCGYPLPHEEPTGACPECGRAYTAEAVRNGWRTAVAWDCERPTRRRKTSRGPEGAVGPQTQETPP